MTVHEKLISMLVSQGMFEEQAKEVMELAKPKLIALADGYDIKFESPENNYPAIIYPIWFMTIRRVALEWIKTNKPQAWYRPMFEKEEA